MTEQDKLDLIAGILACWRELLVALLVADGAGIAAGFAIAENLAGLTAVFCCMAWFTFFLALAQVRRKKHDIRDGRKTCLGTGTLSSASA